MLDIRVPELAESLTEATVISWLKEEGDAVERGEVVAELETDKINVEVYVEADGVLAEITADVGTDVGIGEVIGKVEEGAGGSAPKEEPDEQAVEEETPESAKENEMEREKTTPRPSSPTPVAVSGVATPSERKRAREAGDVPQTKEKLASKQAKTNAPDPEKAKTLDLPESDEYVEVEKMSRRRQTIAKNLLTATQETAMLTTFNEVDMTNVMALRKEINEDFAERQGVKLGFMSLFAKAAVSALKTYPHVNAEIRDEHMLLKKYYNIGIAVTTDEGLVVPVVKDADKKSFAEIEKDIAHLAEKARDRKLELSDLQEGTFTITNGGIFGSLFSTPILNPPQVGILGMHNIVERPISDGEGNIVLRPMMYIALSYDHRIIDGKDSVTFLKHIKELIEEPKRLFLEG